jgi:hypothetical protein
LAADPCFFAGFGRILGIKGPRCILRPDVLRQVSEKKVSRIRKVGRIREDSWSFADPDACSRGWCKYARVGRSLILMQRAARSTADGVKNMDIRVPDVRKPLQLHSECASTAAPQN